MFPFPTTLPSQNLRADPTREHPRLRYLVHLLWQLDLTPGDILVYAGPLPWRSAKWTRFQCSEPHCPYVTMIQERMSLLEEKHKEK